MGDRVVSDFLVLATRREIPMWISVSEVLPTLEDDGGYFRPDQSRCVLATDGRVIQVAYLMVLLIWDDELEVVWKIDGPDGYTFHKVTHWQELPALPAALPE